MLTIYHAKQTRSLRPIWLCHELGVDVEVKTLPFTPEGLADPEFRRLSPAGKIPVMVDGDLTLFESGAIVETILDRYGNGKLRPAEASDARALYRQWCDFSESTLLRPLGFNRLKRAPDDGLPELLDDANQKVHGALSVVENALADADYLIDDTFSAADIMMGYALALLAFSSTVDDRYPNCQRYVAALMAREACQLALAH